MHRYVVFNIDGVLYFCTVNEETAAAIAEHSQAGTRIASVPADADESRWEIEGEEIIFSRKNDDDQ